MCRFFEIEFRYANSRSEDGTIIILISFLLTVLIGFTAFAIDIGSSYYQQRNIHAATDAAALAGVALMVDPSTIVGTSVIDEVLAIGKSNGLSDTEITLNDVDIGNWNFDAANPVFDPAPTALTLNAVRARARRNVPAVFSRIFGWEQFLPSVESIAAVSSPRSVNCAIPFGLEESYLQGRDYGDILTITRDEPGDLDPGNWGKLQLGDGNLSSYPDFLAAMVSPNCNLPAAVGDQVTPATGYAAIEDGFDYRITHAPYVVLPVVTDFGQGTSDEVTIKGFALLRLISQTGRLNAGSGGGSIGNGQGAGNGNSGSGRNWELTFELVKEFVGSSGGGPTSAPYVISRVLVK